MKNYRITIKKTSYGYVVRLYNLMIRPVYDYGDPVPVRHEDLWIEGDIYTETETYLGALWEAWRLKYTLSTGGLLEGGEKTIFERRE